MIAIPIQSLICALKSRLVEKNIPLLALKIRFAQSFLPTA